MNYPVYDAIYDTTAPRRSSNLSVNSSLLDKAKHYNINLSKTLEKALQEKLLKIQQKEWLKVNKEAFESYNQKIEERGVFSDGLRRF